jgi:hypothetical protein
MNTSNYYRLEENSKEESLPIYPLIFLFSSRYRIILTYINLR